MNVIATNKGYYQRRRRPGEVFTLDSEADFRPSWMVKEEEHEKIKQETRPMTLSEIGASKSDSFVAVMNRNRVTQKKKSADKPVDKTPPKPAPAGKRTDISLNS